MNQKQSGLDINLGNECSKNAYNWSKKTFENRKGKAGDLALDIEGGFANMLQFGKMRIGIASDGIGTKIELAERSRIYDTLGYDLLAMVADDLVAGGFEPTNISNIIDVDLLDYDTIDALMKGLHDACNFAGVAISGGEIAELGNRISGYGEGMHFNWCSTAVGVLHESLQKPIDGQNIEVGDAVISLQSRGFRSNGFSLIRRIMQQTYGDLWHVQSYDEQTTWGEKLLTPSLVFSPAIMSLLNAGFQLNGIAHITGGGIADNFQRVLKKAGVGAELDNLFPPHLVMQRLQKLGDVDTNKAYLYWNMGNGMLIVLPQTSADEAFSLLGDSGYNARIAGQIVEGKFVHIVTDSVDLKETY
ncbi:MAG: AIR synthase-related protein [Chitinophagales bacterium]